MWDHSSQPGIEPGSPALEGGFFFFLSSLYCFSFVCMCTCLLSRFSLVLLFVALRTVAHQALLSMGFSRQEHWSGFPYPPPGDLPIPGIVWYIRRSVCAKSLQLFPTVCDPTDCSPLESSVHGILQARILECIAISYSKGSSWPKDWTCISYVSCIGRWVLNL